MPVWYTIITVRVDLLNITKGVTSMGKKKRKPQEQEVNIWVKAGVVVGALTVLWDIIKTFLFKS